MDDHAERDEAAQTGVGATRRWLVVVILIVGAVAGAVVLTYAQRPAILMGTPTSAVAYSVAGETGSPWQGDCKQSDEGRWSCWLATSGGSGTSRYVVTMGKRGCWKATKTTGNEGADGVMPDKLHDCLSLWDWIQVRSPQ